MVANLFPSPGSKSQLAKLLIQCYPPHMRYVEPFAGGAACFWNKAPSVNEILNDYDPEIVNAYTIIRDMTVNDINEFTRLDWTIHPILFDQCQQPCTDPVIAAYRFIYRRRASFMARETQIARQRIGKIIPVAKFLPWVYTRLQGVEITQGDGLALLHELDTENTFFFIDPPWPGYFKKWKHYTMDEIVKLTNAVSEIKSAKWLWAETPTLRQEIDNSLIDQWYIKELAIPSTGFKGRKGFKRELLMSNYSI